MTKIFEVVYKKDTMNDLQEVIDSNQGPNFIKVNTDNGMKSRKDVENEEDLEYIQKVKKYTYFLIGSKFNENT